jgi:hypothetical protein
VTFPSVFSGFENTTFQVAAGYFHALSKRVTLSMAYGRLRTRPSLFVNTDFSPPGMPV